MKQKHFLSFKASALPVPVLLALLTCACANKDETTFPNGAFVKDPAPAVRVPAAQPDASADLPALQPSDSTEPQFVTSPSLPASAQKAKAEKNVVSQYKVQKGDSLWKISKVYGISEKELADFNHLSLKAPLRQGQVILIPSASAKSAKSAAPAAKQSSTKSAPKHDPAHETLYTVKPGDSLSVIAHRYKMKTADLAALNNLDPKKPLYVGKKLVVVKGTGSVVAKTASSSSATAKPVKKAPAAKAKSGKKSSAAKPKAAAPAPKTPAPEKAAAAVPEKSASEQDLLKSLESADEPAPAAAAPAKQNAEPAAAPAAEEEIADKISITLDREMTLEEVAKVYERSIDEMKKINPNIAPGSKLKVGTSIKLPIY